MPSERWRLSHVATFIWAIVAFFLPICSAHKAPYTFVKDATSAAAVAHYDYIVVGGGAASCALVATLSTAAKVLLLERGGRPYDNPNITNEVNQPLLLIDVSPTSPAQSFVSMDGVFNHRARVLGGGTGITVRFSHMPTLNTCDGLGGMTPALWRSRTSGWNGSWHSSHALCMLGRGLGIWSGFQGLYGLSSCGIRENEVILSVGTLGSPQLLMFSGIGPAQHLKAYKIDVILDQLLVGKGMSDNHRTSILISFHKPVEVSLVEVVGITRVGSFIEAFSGFIEPMPQINRMLNDHEILNRVDV